MKKEITISYFTGTGQCKIISEYIANNLTNDGHSVETVNISPFNKRNKMKGTVDCEQLIIIFPIYGSDIPVPMENYITEINGSKIPVLLIALWGNSHKGKALNNACEILCRNGFIVNGAAEIVAEHSYLHTKLPINGDRPTEIEKNELINFIKKRLFKNDLIKPMVNKDSIFIRILCSLPQGSLLKPFAKLTTKQDKCNKCGICRKMCPTGAIKEDFTIDKGNCIMCLSCVTNCKKEARICKIKKIAKLALGHHQKIQNENVFY